MTRRHKAVAMTGVLVLLLMFSSTLLSGCMATKDKAPANGKAPDGYRIDYLTRLTPSDPIFTYWTVAQKMGFFDEEGVNVGEGNGVIHLDAGETAVISGQGAATVSAPNTVITFLAKDPNVNLVGIWNHTPILHYVLAVRPNSPINSVKDLKGKRIAVPSKGHSVNVALPGVLSEAGLSMNDVEIVVLPDGAASGDAITRGDVAVLAYDDTRNAQLSHILGYKLKEIPLPQGIGRAGGPIAVARRSDVEKYPEKYVGYVRALIKGWIFVNTNPRAAAEIQLSTYPQLIPTGKSRQEAFEIVYDQLMARHQHMQVPDWAPTGTLYGEFLEDNWKAWLPVLPDIQGTDVKIAAGYTNDLVRKAWKGIDREKVEKLARESR